MKTSLENVSRKFYAFLDEHDLKVLREYIDEASGALVVDATVPEFRMRFQKLGGEFTLQVSKKDGEAWQDLRRVLEQNYGSSINDDPEILTEYLLSDYDRICSFISA